MNPFLTLEQKQQQLQLHATKISENKAFLERLLEYEKKPPFIEPPRMANINKTGKEAGHIPNTTAPAATAEETPAANTVLSFAGTAERTSPAAAANSNFENMFSGLAQQTKDFFSGIFNKLGDAFSRFSTAFRRRVAPAADLRNPSSTSTSGEDASAAVAAERTAPAAALEEASGASTSHGSVAAAESGKPTVSATGDTTAAGTVPVRAADGTTAAGDSVGTMSGKPLIPQKPYNRLTFQERIAFNKRITLEQARMRQDLAELNQISTNRSLTPEVKKQLMAPYLKKVNENRAFLKKLLMYQKQGSTEKNQIQLQLLHDMLSNLPR